MDIICEVCENGIDGCDNCKKSFYLGASFKCLVMENGDSFHFCDAECAKNWANKFISEFLDDTIAMEDR